MKRNLISEASGLIDKTIKLQGWVNRRRDHGKIIFIDLRDRSGILQIIGGEDLAGLASEDVVEIQGLVKKRDPKNFNPNLPTGKIELEAKQVKIISKAASLPFDMSQDRLKVELPTLLDYRSLTLRHPRIKAIFKVQAVIIDSFRSKLKNLGFTEIQPPTLVPVATEGGAEIFPVKYFAYQVYLSQSPQLYKQIMVSIFEQVFTVARAYRAEPSVTTRHLTEYVSLDCEMGFIDSWTDLMDTAEAVVRHIITELDQQCPEELKLYGAELPKFGKEIPRIKLTEALEIIYQRTKRDNRSQPDLEPEDEREICRWSKEKYGSDFVFVTHYPTKKRPFYTYPDPDNPQETLSFDLIGTGFEWISGGRRLNDYDQLVKNILKWGNKPENFEIYLQSFKYGMPPEGGFAIGAERLTQGVLGLENIREASAFPRDMERVDVRLSTIQVKKNQAEISLFEKLVNLLKKTQVKYRLYEHQPVYTSREAAEVRGLELKQGAKALVMIADKKPILAVVPGDAKLDPAKFKEAYGFNDLKMASPAEVKTITGVEIGAVPPFGNLIGLPTYVAKDLASNREIAFNAGTPTQSIKMSYREFIKLAKPDIADFSQKS